MHLKYDNPLFKRVFVFGLVLATSCTASPCSPSSSGTTSTSSTSRADVMRRPGRRDDRLLALGAAPRGVAARRRASWRSTSTPPGSSARRSCPPARRPSPARRSGWFVFGILLLWVAADWPVHDIGEEYLYLVHMIQHTVLTLVMPPLLLLATPEWLARLVLGEGRVGPLGPQAGSPGARRRSSSTRWRCSCTGSSW